MPRRVCCAQTNVVPEAVDSAPSDLSFNAGADFRIRQKIMHNVPGLPGGAGAMMPRAYREMQNRIRYRPRVWARLDSEHFGLYGRLDNLYFEGRSSTPSRSTTTAATTCAGATTTRGRVL